MQIGSTLACHNNLHSSQTRYSRLRCNGSPLNPRKKPASLSKVSTRAHLSNLEKLLHKQQTHHEQHDIIKPPSVHQQDQPPAVDDHHQKETSSKGSFLYRKSKGPLEGLNLSMFWPAMKAAEEMMSPRNLNRLNRLLSSTAEYSPRNTLGCRWREYHGCNDWAGLLDPLDENLRREMVRYGEFVQAAYHGFHSDPAMPSEQAPSPRRVALPEKSYRVTKSLYATSSVGLPKWVDNVAPDLAWMTQRTSWIGYVAVCEDSREIQRMGRRDIVIALRGTATCLEWAENMRDLLVKVPGQNDSDTEQSKVECGFLSLYKTQGAHVPSLSESVVEEVKRLVDLYKGENLSITVTGHSLGAALSLLVADELSTCTATDHMPPLAVFSFGGPRVGNHGFTNRVNAKNIKVLRVVNSQDVITRVPGMFVSEALDQKLRNTSIGSKVLNVIDNKMPWAYSHVGTELRLDTKQSPFLKPDADVACCHDLEAYLHLVDGFSASNCPFRANAKRSLVKLLNEQRSNVKKLYTSNAKALSVNLDKQEFTMTATCLQSPS